ncbi:MAG: hypothetical protein J2P18_18640 [Nocardia sp.]|nr:hypothetical protein [Nocardia sp.]
MHQLAADGIRVGLDTLLRVLDDGEPASRKPFAEPDILRPNLDSRRFGWTHYGVMIPDLTEPHRFLSVMSLIGATGSVAFDTDHALPAAPRRTASVVAGTAASHPGHFGTYEIGRDFLANPDGSSIRFGEDLQLLGGYPGYRLTGTLGPVTVDLNLNCSDLVTWFFHNPVNKHLSLLTDYSGTLAVGSDAMNVEGMCSFEYGACPSPYLLSRTALPQMFKAPLDHFVYHIVNLDADNQILLTHLAIGGKPFRTTAYHRTRGAESTSFPDVRFAVLAHRPEPEPTPYGRPMPLPAATRFEVRDDRGQVWLDLRTDMDTPFTYGLGSGFVSGFAHTATWRGEQISGRGYVEYIDRRNG